MANAILFNCCTDNAPPDWSLFKSLEIGGCIDDPEEPGHTIGNQPDDSAEFWTVYARHHSGEAEAITDCPTRAAADETAAELAKLSRLPLL